MVQTFLINNIIIIKKNLNIMKKVSVVMASYLGEYPGRTSNPEPKFIRAVKSFLSQTYENKELIICADGCDRTVEIYNSGRSWQNWNIYFKDRNLCTIRDIYNYGNSLLEKEKSRVLPSLDLEDKILFGDPNWNELIEKTELKNKTGEVKND